jgi:transposase-like protein
MAKGRDRDGRREDRWRGLIDEQKHSGLSIRAFCRGRKLAESAFYFWRRELQRRQDRPGQRPTPESSGSPAFVAVRVSEADAEPGQLRGESAASGRIEIVLAGGHRVAVAAPVDRQALTDVLAVLEGRPC